MSVHPAYFDLATPLVDLDLQREGALLSGGGVCQAPLGQLVLAPAVVWDSTQPTRRSGGGRRHPAAAMRHVAKLLWTSVVVTSTVVCFANSWVQQRRVICRFRECVAVEHTLRV